MKMFDVLAEALTEKVQDVVQSIKSMEQIIKKL